MTPAVCQRRQNQGVGACSNADRGRAAVPAGEFIPAYGYSDLQKSRNFCKSEHIQKSTKLFHSDERRTWIPLKKVASAIGVSERTLRRYAIQGRVPGGRQRSGRNGTWYFRREVIEEWRAGKIFGYEAASEFSGYSIARLKQMVERGEISVRKMSWNRVAFDPVKLEVELKDYIRKHWIPARTPPL